MAFAQEQQLSVEEVRLAVRHTLTDRNPDYGLRGCRITAFYPDITEMQVVCNMFVCLYSIAHSLHYTKVVKCFFLACSIPSVFCWSSVN